MSANLLAGVEPTFPNQSYVSVADGIITSSPKSTLYIVAIWPVSRDAVAESQTVHASVSMKWHGAAATSGVVDTAVSYYDADGSKKSATATISGITTEWRRFEMTYSIPSGATIYNFYVASNCLNAALDITDPVMSYDSPVTLAAASHTPYATQEYVDAEKADVSTIVPKASVESSTTASQAYAAGQYVVVNGVLRKVTASIVKGNAITDSNSTATTVTGEFASFARVETKDSVHNINKDDLYCYYTKRNGIVYLTITYVQGHTEGLQAISTKMPNGYRPINGFETYFTIGHESSTEKKGLCKVFPDGTIKTITSDNSAFYAGVVAYPAE